MTFLSPWVIAIAAGLAVPPLVALYFLKLKRAVRIVPSTLLWKKAIEDLHVNAPFQRLRSSLLLLLQLAVIALAALALGKPMFQTAPRHTDTLIMLIDQSASMSVVEEDGLTRLEHAKKQAKQCVDNLADGAQAMVIAFADRAMVISSFDADRRSLHAKIDSIDQTQAPTQLSEAIALAEAYTQTVILGGEEPSVAQEMRVGAPPPTMFLFTDGRLEDEKDVSSQSLDLGKLEVRNVGRRTENVAILTMDARRNYERPSILEVAATVGNFTTNTLRVDVALLLDGRNVDVQSVEIPALAEQTASEAAPGTAVVAFDPVEFEGAGVAEMVLSYQDAFPLDDRAWVIIEEPDKTKVLLVTQENPPLLQVLRVLPIELTTMKPAEYEAAAESSLSESRRSLFDVVIIDRHKTSRLAQGNYFFWGSAPDFADVVTGEPIRNEVIFNWDDTHPVLRHVSVDALDVAQWLRLGLPRAAVQLIEGESSPILAYFTRNASQFLVCAFSLVIADDAGNLRYNTDWTVSVDFVLFMHNALEFLSGNLAARASQSTRPGAVVTIPVSTSREQITITRPDKTKQTLPVSESRVVHYANTRHVGAYQVDDPEAARPFAVNLFDPNESNIAPVSTVTLGTQAVTATSEPVAVNQPAWRFVLIAMFLVLALEWIVYNKRIFV